MAKGYALTAWRAVIILNDVVDRRCEADQAPRRLIGIRDWEIKSGTVGDFAVSKFEARIEIDGTLPRGVWFRASGCPKQMDSAIFQHLVV